jgi:iron(III) transport system substrate-binding protein
MNSLRSCINININIILAFIFIVMTAMTAMADSISPPQKNNQLSIYGAADLSEIKPLLDDFQKHNPTININYREFSSNLLEQYIRETKLPQPDITISSVMELQIRLVNDGFALPHRVKMQKDHNGISVIPPWSQWRDELFGFSYEPAVIVFNQDFLKGKSVPTNRVELINFIRRHSNELMGKIGLYDIRSVGMGYLLWAFEREQTTNYGQFLELFNQHDARTFNSSSAMLKALHKNEIAIAYNILGSYARSWQTRHQDVVIVATDDYTPVIIRSAFINKTTEKPETAKKFIDYFLSYSGQTLMGEKTNMAPVRTDIKGSKSASMMRKQLARQLKPLPLNISLLVFSDQSKKELVITEWENALKRYE